MDGSWFLKGQSTRFAIYAAINVALAVALVLMGLWVAAIAQLALGLAMLMVRSARRPPKDIERAIRKSADRVGGSPP